jgi:hypothetical protein
MSARDRFAEAWRRKYGKDWWNNDPLVWVVSFNFNYAATGLPATEEHHG